MKNIRNIKIYRFILATILFLIFPIKSSTSGSLFGPANYEECVADGKVGRTNAEVAAQMQMCRKKFPKLFKISKSGIGSIKCTSAYDKSNTNFLVKQGAILLEGAKTEHKIIAKNSELIRFEGDGENSISKKKVKMYGELNLSTGFLQIDVVYQDNSRKKIDYFFECIE